MLKALRVLLAIIGFILIGDCLALMLLGKTNFGTAVPLLIGVIFVIHGLFWTSIRKFIANRTWIKRFWYASWGVFVVWLASFVVFIFTLQHQIQQSRGSIPTASNSVSAIIVLGGGTTDGKPTATLAKRLDTAAPIIKAHPDTVAVTSGGVGFGHTKSEADIMATYLQDVHNIPLTHIIQEGESTSTEENFAYTQPLLESKGITKSDPIAIVTSDFHIVRSRAIAKRQGYTQPILIASPTPISIRYNAWFREYFAFVSGWLLDEY